MIISIELYNAQEKLLLNVSIYNYNDRIKNGYKEEERERWLPHITRKNKPERWKCQQ